MATLTDYLTQTRRLLHDASGRFWSDAELTDYINEARIKTVWFTKALRRLQPFTLTAQLEVYSFSALPQNITGNQTLDVLNINLIWGSSRVPLRWMDWTHFNAQLRIWQNFYGMPRFFSMYGQDQFYLGQAPDQNYAVEIDSVISPLPLTTTAPNEQMLDPYTSPVKYYAAKMAKFEQQAYNDATRFEQLFLQDIRSVLMGIETRRIASPYRDPY